MPGEVRPSVVDVLSSQGLGVACGVATVLLLAVGSFVLAFGPEEARPAMDDARLLLTVPSWRHTWFYLLLGVLTLYGVNTLLCTWTSSLRAWRAGVRSIRAHAPLLLHASFGAALLAHLVAGFWSQERGMVSLGPDWTDLPWGGAARVLDVTTDTHPDGSPRQVHARLEMRGEGGEVYGEEIAYNDPLFARGGTEMALLARAGRTVSGVRVSRGDDTCTLEPGDACPLGDGVLRLVRVATRGHWGDRPVAFFEAAGGSEPGGATSFFLWEGAVRPLPDGSTLALDGFLSTPVVLCRARHAPGTPLALVSAVLLVAGVLAMGSRWFPAEPRTGR